MAAVKKVSISEVFQGWEVGSKRSLSLQTKLCKMQHGFTYWKKKAVRFWLDNFSTKCSIMYQGTAKILWCIWVYFLHTQALTKLPLSSVNHLVLTADTLCLTTYKLIIIIMINFINHIFAFIVCSQQKKCTKFRQ